MLLAAIGLVLQACAALGQSSYYPNGGTQSFNLTPYCRSGIAGTLSFNGGSVIESTPDTATVSVTINGNGTSAAEARELAADTANRVFDALLRVNGIDPEDLTTTYVSVSPQIAYNSVTGSQEDNGFAFSNSLTVKVNNVTNDQLAQVLDTLVRAGGDYTSIDGVMLSLSPGLENDLTNEARRGAVADAKATAQLYAQELGVRLGAILAFTDNTVTFTPQGPASASSNTALASKSTGETATTPVELGSQSVSVSVNVAYSICTADAAN